MLLPKGRSGVATLTYDVSILEYTALLCCLLWLLNLSVISNDLGLSLNLLVSWCIIYLEWFRLEFREHLHVSLLFSVRWHQELHLAIWTLLIVWAQLLRKCRGADFFDMLVRYRMSSCSCFNLNFLNICAISIFSHLLHNQIFDVGLMCAIGPLRAGAKSAHILVSGGP